MSKINIGDKVHCTHAETTWYTVNKIYEVVAHPENGYASVVGSDGFHDLLSMCQSKFAKVNPQEAIIETVDK